LQNQVKAHSTHLSWSAHLGNDITVGWGVGEGDLPRAREGMGEGEEEGRGQIDTRAIVCRIYWRVHYTLRKAQTNYSELFSEEMLGIYALLSCGNTDSTWVGLQLTRFRMG